MGIRHAFGKDAGMLGPPCTERVTRTTSIAYEFQRWPNRKNTKGARDGGTRARRLQKTPSVELRDHAPLMTDVQIDKLRPAKPLNAPAVDRERLVQACQRGHGRQQFLAALEAAVAAVLREPWRAMIEDNDVQGPRGRGVFAPS